MAGHGATLSLSKKTKEKLDEFKKYVMDSNYDTFLNWLIDTHPKMFQFIQEEKNKRLKLEFIEWSELNPTKSWQDFLAEKLK